jgi:2-polyprenyl-3-methyl-5-hydroxy-6-metoxy-1,4-benzoquinol methylase
VVGDVRASELTIMSTGEFADAKFGKYAESGAYHWREIGAGLIAHNAFTAERYRRVVDSGSLREGDRVLDYGCGDGALLSVLHRRSRGRSYELHGFDPNALAVELAGAALASHGVKATIHSSLKSLPDAYFDRVLCTEVIEHASAPGDLLLEVARVLKPGGRLVVTTPIRLTERPEDVNHVREWFPDEFIRIFQNGAWRVIAHEQVVPAAAVEAYFWRPPVFARVPVFRLLCNLLSIYAGVNAMSWLRVRQRLFMMQFVIVEKV